MTFWIAATAFLATNVDNLFLLTLWFVKRSGFATILRRQLDGFSAILLVSLVGYLGLRLLPGSAVHWLGDGCGADQRLQMRKPPHCQPPASAEGIPPQLAKKMQHTIEILHGAVGCSAQSRTV
jgi:hypothetical protein